MLQKVYQVMEVVEIISWGVLLEFDKVCGEMRGLCVICAVDDGY